MTPPRVLMRADGGAMIGLGHLSRSLSLATALQRAGASPFFAVFGDGAAVERARAAGFPGKSVEADDEAEITALIWEWGCSVVVVDTYLITDDYLAALRKAGAFVVAIDDLNEYPFPCQMVVSMGPHAPDLGYRSSSGDTKFLLGPRFAILRPEFWDAPQRPLRDSVRNVLVTTGGADPAGVLPQWLHAVDEIDADFSITTVVGPFFTNADDVHDAAASCGHTVRVATAPAVMRPLLASADVALTAGGQTIYELAALGVPTVAVEIADNQRPQLQAFSKLGAMIVPETHEQVRGAVASLIASQDQRRALSETARGIVNRRGALAVADEIVAGVS